MPCKFVLIVLALVMLLAVGGCRVGFYVEDPQETEVAED